MLHLRRNTLLILEGPRMPVTEVSHAYTQDSYPGGSFTALRSLAFFLSWLRHLYTKDKVLYVSQRVLDALRAWQTLPDKAPEEIQLAKTLSEDFGRWEAVEARARAGDGRGDVHARGDCIQRR